MSGPDVMYPEEQAQIAIVCQRLHRDANAKAEDMLRSSCQPDDALTRVVMRIADALRSGFSRLAVFRLRIASDVDRVARGSRGSTA